MSLCLREKKTESDHQQIVARVSKTFYSLKLGMPRRQGDWHCTFQFTFSLHNWLCPRESSRHRKAVLSSPQAKKWVSSGLSSNGRHSGTQVVLASSKNLTIQKEILNPLHPYTLKGTSWWSEKWKRLSQRNFICRNCAAGSRHAKTHSNIYQLVSDLPPLIKEEQIRNKCIFPFFWPVPIQADPQRGTAKAT